VRVTEHTGYVRSDECPAIGCSRGRTVICAMKHSDGTRVTVSACEKHIAWYVARGVMRWLHCAGGDEAVARFVDDEPERVLPGRCIA
jgi:hypothetical protein